MDAQPEPTTPSEAKKSISWRVFFLWPLVILVLYVLSFGPVVKSIDDNSIATTNKLVNVLYAPMYYALYETPLRKPLMIYLHLWVPPLIDQNGEAPPRY